MLKAQIISDWFIESRLVASSLYSNDFYNYQISIQYNMFDKWWNCDGLLNERFA